MREYILRIDAFDAIVSLMLRMMADMISAFTGLVFCEPIVDAVIHNSS